MCVLIQSERNTIKYEDRMLLGTRMHTTMFFVKKSTIVTIYL